MRLELAKVFAMRAFVGRDEGFTVKTIGLLGKGLGFLAKILAEGVAVAGMGVRLELLGELIFALQKGQDNL